MPPSDPALDNMHRDADRMNQERTRIAEEVRALQYRYDDMYNRNEAEIRRKCYDFRRSKQHYSGKVLARVLEHIFKNRQKRHFDYMFFQQSSDDR